MKDLSISVIVPAYNAEDTLARAIDSALAQTVVPDEILVIDDGSADGTARVAERYDAPVRLISKPNGGAASARNAGLDTATGTLVALLDADDYWEPHKLERQRAEFERCPELVMLSGCYYEQEPGEPRVASQRPEGVTVGQPHGVRGVDALEYAMYSWTGSVMARRDAIGDQRYVSGLEPAEDRDFWFRLALKGPVGFLDEPLATAVLEAGSLSRSNVARDCGNMLRTITRNRDELPAWARAKWSSHTHYRWAACDPDRGKALRQLGLSLLKWPLPYPRRDVSMPFARARLLARLTRDALLPTTR